MKITVFWYLAACSLINIRLRFRWIFRLLLEGACSPKTWACINKTKLHHIPWENRLKIDHNENFKSQNFSYSCCYLKFRRHTFSYLAGNKFAVSESNGLFAFTRTFLHQSKQAYGVPDFASEVRSGKTSYL